MKILIGTNNLNKFKNYKDAFDAYAPEIELFKPDDLNIAIDPKEDGNTLYENAVKKAKAFGEASGMIVIADDTGLFVDALNGEPGLHTNRWFAGSDHDRCVKLLERLNGKNRKAHYGWAVVAYNPLNKKIWSFECEVEGFISDEFRDTGGFGYDKMFKMASMDKHYSELSKEELIENGGRGRAV
ncbi:MAG: non-canonical purine NTP pyrophosphatase, partial [Candidatus Staskawiczbacteria bacterium]